MDRKEELEKQIEEGIAKSDKINERLEEIEGLEDAEKRKES